jgi:hypothetical protein
MNTSYKIIEATQITQCNISDSPAKRYFHLLLQSRYDVNNYCFDNYKSKALILRRQMQTFSRSEYGLKKVKEKIFVDEQKEQFAETLKQHLSILGGFTWLGDVLGGLAKDDQEKEIEKIQKLFDHVYEGYADYFEKSKTSDVHLTHSDYQDWSIRKSSHSGKIAKSVYTKFNAKQDNSFNLHEKGVYLENYNLEGNSYQVAIYSAQSTVSLKNDKVRLKGYKELAGHTYVKAGYTKKYGIIVLYDDSKKFQLLLQISGSDSPDKTAEEWLNYLAIVVASEEQKEYDKSVWDKIKDRIGRLFTTNELPGVWEETSTDNFEIQLFDGSSRSGKDSVMLIMSTPAMPDIRAKIISSDNGNYKMKLVISYLRRCTGNGSGRSPNQTTTFPSAGWHEIKSGKEWKVDFGVDAITQRPVIRGGIAYLIAESPVGVRDTLRFFIKGTNPTVSQLNNYLNQAPYNQAWFFKKIIFHESGTPNNLTAEVRQFNPYNRSRENLSENNWDAVSRMPTFGPPCGWGLGQLDNPAPAAQALWDWQANIRAAYDLLMDKQEIVLSNLDNAYKIVSTWNYPGNPIVVQPDRIEGGITYTHAPSPSFNHEINTHFSGQLANNRRSFIDACWIKLYNGLGSERQHYYWLAPAEEDSPPQWNITNTATSGTYTNYYVRDVSQRSTP